MKQSGPHAVAASIEKIAEKVQDFSIMQTKIIIFDEYGKLKKADMMKQKISQVQNGLTLSVQQIACGKNHCMLLTKSGLVHSFGQGDYGQLGHSNFTSKSEPELILNLSNF